MPSSRNPTGRRRSKTNVPPVSAAAERPASSTSILRRLASKASKLLKNTRSASVAKDIEASVAPNTAAQAPAGKTPARRATVRRPERVPTWLEKGAKEAPAPKKPLEPPSATARVRKPRVRRPERTPTWIARRPSAKGLEAAPPAQEIPPSFPIRPFVEPQPAPAVGRGRTKAAAKRQTSKSNNGASVAELIVLLVKDPWWLYAYWDIRPEQEKAVRAKLLADEIEGLRIILRVYDVTDSERHPPSFDIGVSSLATKWYVPVNAPGRTFVVELGFLTRAGRFLPITRSNRAMSPRFGPASAEGPWNISEAEYWQLVGLTTGAGITLSSDEIRRQFEQQKLSTGGGLFSPGVFSMTVPVGLFSPGGSPTVKLPDFWMWVNTELIVYGATDPKAKLTVQDQNVPLRPDGTFALRFLLPDGAQTIPVKALSSDGVHTRQATIRIQRESAASHAEVLRPLNGPAEAPSTCPLPFPAV